MHSFPAMPRGYDLQRAQLYVGPSVSRGLHSLGWYTVPYFGPVSSRHDLQRAQLYVSASMPRWHDTERRTVHRGAPVSDRIYLCCAGLFFAFSVSLGHNPQRPRLLRSGTVSDWHQSGSKRLLGPINLSNRYDLHRIALYGCGSVSRRRDYCRWYLRFLCPMHSRDHDWRSAVQRFAEHRNANCT
jgi:hypothetical protein